MSRVFGSTTPNRVLGISVLTVVIATSASGAYFNANCPNCEFSPQLFLLLTAIGALWVLSVFGWVLCLVGAARLFVNMFKVWSNTNSLISEAPYWLRWNRNNLLFCPKYLNERGLEARRKVFNDLLLIAVGLALAIPAILVTETF